MMRKILTCFFCVLLVAVLALPAFATEPDPIYSPLQFESVYTSESTVAYPWPYNAIDVSSQQVDYDFDHNGFLGDYSILADNSVFGTFTMPELQGQYAGFSIYFENHSAQFIDKLAMSSFGISAGSVAEWMQVYISYNVWEPVVNNNDHYILSPRSVSFDTTVQGGDVRLGVLIGSKLTANTDYYLISDLVVRLVMPTYSGSIQQVAVTYNYLRDNDFASLYFGERDLKQRPIDPSEVGLFDWLLNSVQAFLDLEIFPDFSINSLFVLIVVIGCLFWFLTLLI